MKAQDAEAIKAQATRAMLTCRCSHPQLGHYRRPLGDSPVMAEWLACLEQGCRCPGFRPILSSQEKRQLDITLDEKVAKGRLAAVLKHQAEEDEAHPNGRVKRVAQFPASSRPKGKHTSKERVQSADRAGTSSIYHRVAGLSKKEALQKRVQDGVAKEGTANGR